jgi:hypothetical protein
MAPRSSGGLSGFSIHFGACLGARRLEGLRILALLIFLLSNKPTVTQSHVVNLHDFGCRERAELCKSMIAFFHIVHIPVGAVWTLSATPRLRCGGRFGRHNCDARSVAWCGAIGGGIGRHNCDARSVAWCGAIGGDPNTLVICKR